MATVYKHVPNQVARMAGDHSEMDDVARKLLFAAKVRARRHRLTGAYIAQLSAKNVPGKKGVRDRLVIAGDKAAMSIEYGHTARTGNTDPSKADLRWVPGQYILTGAINSLDGYKYNSFGVIR